jgi:hypothetical protein
LLPQRAFNADASKARWAPDRYRGWRLCRICSSIRYADRPPGRERGSARFRARRLKEKTITGILIAELPELGGLEARNDRSPRPDRVWNRVPDVVQDRIIMLALDEPTLSPRKLALRFTDTQLSRVRGFGLSPTEGARLVCQAGFHRLEGSR